MKNILGGSQTPSCSNKVTVDIYIDVRSYDRYGRNVDWYQVKKIDAMEKNEEL